MDNYKEKIIIANSESDFISNDGSVFSASYIILCKNETPDDEMILKTSVCGLSFPEWVALSCENKPVFLSVTGNENILELTRPYVNNSEYIVVLYANTPLITKSHLNDMLSFVARKRFNACKLKKGYILRSEFVLEAEAIYSNFVYDLATNDFFEVNSIADIQNVRSILEKRVLFHHAKKGVIFDNLENINIDASVKIGAGTKVSGLVTILENSTIGDDTVIEPNTIIINSKIADHCKIGSGSIIKNSIIKNNSEINVGAEIVHSIIGEETKIGNSTKIIDSAISQGVEIENFSQIDSANINPNAVIGKFSCIAGVGVNVVVDENAKIPAFSKIVKFDE